MMISTIPVILSASHKTPSYLGSTDSSRRHAKVTTNKENTPVNKQLTSPIHVTKKLCSTSSNCSQISDLTCESVYSYSKNPTARAVFKQKAEHNVIEKLKLHAYAYLNSQSNVCNQPVRKKLTHTTSSKRESPQEICAKIDKTMTKTMDKAHLCSQDNLYNQSARKTLAYRTSSTRESPQEICAKIDKAMTKRMDKEAKRNEIMYGII